MCVVLSLSHTSSTMISVVSPRARKRGVVARWRASSPRDERENETGAHPFGFSRDKRRSLAAYPSQSHGRRRFFFRAPTRASWSRSASCASQDAQQKTPRGGPGGASSASPSSARVPSDSERASESPKSLELDAHAGHTSKSVWHPTLAHASVRSVRRPHPSHHPQTSSVTRVAPRASKTKFEPRNRHRPSRAATREFGRGSARVSGASSPAAARRIAAAAPRRETPRTRTPSRTERRRCSTRGRACPRTSAAPRRATL